MKTISVALATFNGERFLGAQLKSLAHQLRLPDELIVGDDGSTDRTMQIVRDFAATAPFSVVILPHQQRLGYRANFMRCAHHSTGDLIAFCDQDDVWLPEKLQHQAETLSSPDVLLCSHAVRLIDDAGNPLQHDYSFFDRAATSSYSALPPFPFALGMTVCMKRQCMRWDTAWSLSLDCNDVRERMAHDQWYPFVASLLGKISFATDALALYRQHQANVSGNRVAKSRLSILLAKLQSRAMEYRRLETSATACSEVLANLIEDVSTRNDQGVLACLEDARSRYIALSTSLERRAQTTEARSLPAKMRSVGRALRAGDYRRNSRWHFQPGGAIRDIMEFPSG